MNISLSLYRIRIGCFATVASRIKAGKKIDLIVIVYVNLFMRFKSNAIPLILLKELMYTDKQCPTSNQYVYTSSNTCAAWFHYSCNYCANTASLRHNYVTYSCFIVVICTLNIISSRSLFAIMRTILLLFSDAEQNPGPTHDIGEESDQSIFNDSSSSDTTSASMEIFL